MSFKPSEVIKNKRQPSTFNYKRHLHDKIGADTYNTDIEQFNKDYGADYLSNWHTADEINSYYDRLASITDRTKAYQSYVNLYGTDEQKAVLGDIDKQVKSYSDVLGQRQNVLDYYGRFGNAEGYNNYINSDEYKIGWLNPDSEVTADLSQKRQAKYQSNAARIKELENDPLIIVDKKLKSELERLRAENQKYENEQQKLDSYYTPITEEFKQNAAYRDYINVSGSELFDLNSEEQEIYSLLNNGIGVFDENGNIVNAYNGKVIYSATDLSRAISNNTTADFYNSLVQDKLGMFRSASDEDISTAYDRLGTATGYQDTWVKLIREGDANGWSELTEGEVDIYYDLLKTKGQEAAYKYLSDMTTTLTRRATKKAEENVANAKGWEKFGLNLASIPMNVFGGIASFSDDVTSVIKGENINPYSRSHLFQNIASATRQSTAEDINKLTGNAAIPLIDFTAGDAYQAIMSGADSLLGAALGGTTYGIVMGMGAASATAKDLYEKGATLEQIALGSLAAGAAEMVFEKYSIEKFIEMGDSDTIAKLILNTLKQGGIEASEEALTEIANTITNSIIMGSQSDWKDTGTFIKNVVNSALGGFISGSGMGTVGATSRYATNKIETNLARLQIGEETIKKNKVEALLKESKALFKGDNFKKEQRLIADIEKNLDKTDRTQKRNIGKLTESYYTQAFKELNKQVAEKSIENVAETRKNVESETKKLKVNSSSAEINYDNMPQILGFEGANLDKTMVETEQGAVKLTDMEISNAEIGDLYAYAVRLGSTESANAFIQNWDQTTDPLYYWLDWTKLQTRGLYAPEKMEKAMSDYSDVKLSPTAKLAAFKSGMSLRTSAREKMEADSAKLRETYKELGGTAKKGKFDDSKLNYSALTKEQKDVVNFTKILSDYLGVNITYFKSEKGKRGANGYYSAKNNTIYLDIYAGIGNKESYSAIKDCLVNTVSHEIVHNMAVNAPAEYGALRDFVIERLSEEEGFDLDSRVEQIMLENSDQGFTAEDAIEEIVAMSCEDLLGSSERLQEAMTQFYAKNEKAANSFTKYVREVLNRLKQFFEKIIGKKSISEESQLMAKQSAEFISELQKRYDAALLAVREGNAVRNTLGNLTATEQVTLAESGIAVDETTGDVHKVRNSVRYSTANKDAQGNIIDLVTVGKKSFNTEAIAKLVSTATGRSIEDARKWVRSEMAIANLVMDNPEFLDFEPDDRFQGIKKNSDYPQGTVDLSNLCPKREEFTTMFDLLQKKYPDKLFTAADVASMREILKNHGITVACGACFVEDRRQLLGEIADTYINMWREAVENGTPLQKTNAEGKKIKLQVTAALAKQYGLTKGADIMATDKYIPTQYDLTTYEGFKLLEKNHPLVAMGFNRYNNSRGQQAGRLIEGRAEYDRQILGWTPNKVKTVNNNGGLRIFSFSDFEVVHLLDLVQVIIDCAAMGVKIQGYTKIPAFARLVRNTGIKLNRSLIPKGETGIKVVNGKEALDIDLVEGINIEDENFLDESDNDNVGNIIIGINPKQIGIAMLDDFIDYIIPFHTNKSKDICRKLGVGTWENYKESQHEKDIDSGKASKHNVNIYTQVINKYHPTNKTEFVDAFLKECRSQKKIPRYSEFLYKEYKADGAYSDEGGRFDYTYREGYHKLLVDFKMFDKEGNILPQGDIVPELDDAFMAELLDKEIARKKDYTFPQEVYDEIDRVFGDGGKVMRQARAESEDEKTFKQTRRDTEYLDAVNRGDMETAQRMVDDAAREWGAITNGNTKKPRPLHLYHGTGSFGFTRFRDGRIYATAAASVASGYNRGQGLGRVRSSSLKYIPNDGTVETAIKNAKNVLGATLTKLDDVAKQNIISKADNILKDIANKVSELDEATDYGKATEFFEYLTEKYGEDKSLKWTNQLDQLHYMLVSEYTAEEILADGKWLVHDLEKYHEWKQDLSELWSEEREAIKDSTLDKVFRYLLGYEYGDALIDIEFGLGRLLDDRKKLVNPNGNLVYLDDIVDGIEMAKDTGIYDLYGYPGEKPLIIDEGKRFWDAIPFENGFRSTDYIAKWAKENGYTSVLFKTVLDPSSGGSANVYADEWVFFNSNQIKSADPVTYDDDGNVIPLSERFNETNPDIRYQKRIETPGASEVLSELFRDNPNLNGYADQRKELKSYQELLRSVKVNEQRIAEIDAEIKSLKSQKAQGGKGTRMAQLYEMRKTAEDRVTEKKNRMFKMEATSLRDVVTRETARLLQERTEEERSLSRQKQKDIRENYARREYIKKIEQRAKGLQEAITKAGQKHIPEPFKKVVSDLITSIDFSSKRSLAGKGETKKEMQIKSAMRGLSDLMTSNTLSSENEGKNSSEEIQGFLMACDITGEFAQEFDSLYKEIDAISESVGNDTDLILQRMSSEQLKRLNSALYKLSGQISKVNKLMENNLYKDIPEMSYDFLQFAKQFRLKGDISVIERLLDTDQLIPYYAFKRMGKVGLALFNEWANGFDQYAKLSKEIVDTTENLYTAKEVKRWTNEVHEFTIRDQKYYFTTAHLMSFYLLHKQEDSKRHLEGYGMAVESFKTDNLKQYKNSVTGTFLTESDIVTLLTELEKDKRAIEVAEKLQQFMATECADWANYITMRRFGEKAYTIKDYFPIESSKADMNTEKGAGGFMSLYYLLNKSFTKARVLNANNKIMIRDIFDVFSNHTTEVAAYRSFGLPLLDMLKFYNYQYTAEVIADKQVKSDRKSVKGIMEDVFGKGYKNYIESFIRDVTGANPPVEETAITKVVSGLVSKTKVAAVAFNLRVVALQGTSYIRAGAVLKQRYLLQEIKDTPQLRRAMETMEQYSGVAIWKNELGFRDVNITRGLQEKIKHKDTVWDKVTEASMKGAKLGDRMTWGAIWLACENEIKDTQKNLAVGSEAFNEAVATRFREVIYATQVVDSPLAKSHVMRRKDIYHRFATNFMSEPTVSYNLLLDSYYEAASAKRRGVKLSRKNYRQIGKLAVVYIQSAVVQAIFESFIDALRRRANDEEDETLLNAYVDELWRNVLKELSVLRKIPYLKNVSDLAERYWFNGFSYNNQMEIAAFEKPIKFIADFTDFVMGEDVSITKLVKSLLEALSSPTGLPLGNVYRTVRTIWNNVVEMFNDGSGRIE